MIIKMFSYYFFYYLFGVYKLLQPEELWCRVINHGFAVALDVHKVENEKNSSTICASESFFI